MSCKGKEDIMKHCGPRAECEERKKCGKDKCLRHITAYEVDTCLIRYKPRLLYVDPCFKDCEENCFKSLDDALRCLKPDSGGYVIKLSRGTHRLGVNVELRVDNLTIIGDTSPVKGVPFINGQRFAHSLIPTVPRYDSRIGKGPYRVTVNGTKIKVYGQCDPDFSSVCEGDEIGFVFSDRAAATGEIRNFTVKCTKGNTITVDSSLGLNRSLFIGEGFFIYPNTRIETGCDHKIFTTSRLEFAGINFLIGTTLVCGAGIYTSLRNCVISTGTWFARGQYISSIPNVIITTFIFSDTSLGLMTFQGVLGPLAVVIFNGNPGVSFSGCVVSLCRVGVAVINGGKAHFDYGDFFLNETGIRATSGSSVHIVGAYFRENIVAVNGFYNSSISSESAAVFGVQEVISGAPLFINNRLTMGAEWGTFYNVSNIKVEKLEGDPYVRLDGRLRATPADNPNDSLGNAGSFIADGPNQFAGIE